MSRFKVGEEITARNSCMGLTRGKFYRVNSIDGNWAVISNDEGGKHCISNEFGLTRAEYEQAERKKDPFAPGKWVVCVRNDTPAKVGDVVMVTAYHATNPEDWFQVTMVGGPCNMRKSRFRPAPPEEIKEQEKKIMDEKNGDKARANRQTFYVAGQEFYVGQTVWASSDGAFAKVGTKLTVIGRIGPHVDELSIAVREYDGIVAFACHVDGITATKPKPHEWKFGDWARRTDDGIVAFACHVDGITATKPKPHEWKFGDWARRTDGVIVFVASEVDDDGDVLTINKGKRYGYLNPKNLTYISTAEIPE